MPQSLHEVYAHIVFSTKDRAALIPAEMERDLYSYLGGIVRDLGATPVISNGMPDHLHLLIRASKNTSDSDFMRQLKGSSSKWMSDQGARGFKWQGGYGWFGVGSAERDRVRAYIEVQKEHHKKVSFQEEYRRLLEELGVEYDARYLWD